MMNQDSADLPASSGPALPAGTRLEEFVVRRVLGSGGFGITYLAWDSSLERLVVIKENLPVLFAHRDTGSLRVRPGSGRDDAENFQWSLANFSREASMLASLRHSGIVPVLRSFEALGTGYFVMPYVEGETLSEKTPGSAASGSPAMAEEDVRRMLGLLLEAIAYLHHRGIYHRDIKAGNILVTKAGDPVLIDFGSARQRLGEKSLTVVESAGYTPFEQLQSNGKVGPWSDLYALGATLCKLLSGEVPPRANDRVFDDPWIPLASRSDLRARYSLGLLQGIDRALAVPIASRWQRAEDWMQSLAAGLAAKKPANRAAAPTATDGTAVAERRQGKLPALLKVVVAAVVLAIAVTLLLPDTPPSRGEADETLARKTREQQQEQEQHGGPAKADEKPTPPAVVDDKLKLAKEHSVKARELAASNRMPEARDEFTKVLAQEAGDPALESEAKEWIAKISTMRATVMISILPKGAKVSISDKGYELRDGTIQDVPLGRDLTLKAVHPGFDDGLVKGLNLDRPGESSLPDLVLVRQTGRIEFKGDEESRFTIERVSSEAGDVDGPLMATSAKHGDSVSLGTGLYRITTPQPSTWDIKVGKDTTETCEDKSRGWKTVEIAGKTYVEVSGMKDFYGFTNFERKANEVIMDNKKVLVKMLVGSRECLMNGVKFELSHPLIEDKEGNAVISQMDLAKLVDPVLRPNYIDNPEDFKTVIIDSTTGVSSANYELAKKLKEALAKRGFQAELTFGPGDPDSESKRLAAGNAIKESAVLVMLGTSKGRSPEERGVHTYSLAPIGVMEKGPPPADGYPAKPGNKNDSASLALATAVHSSVVVKLKKHTLDRGIGRTRNAILEQSLHPSILVEYGNLANKQDAALIKVSAYQDAVVTAIVDGIERYRRARKGAPAAAPAPAGK